METRFPSDSAKMSCFCEHAQELAASFLYYIEIQWNLHYKEHQGDLKNCSLNRGVPFIEVIVTKII